MTDFFILFIGYVADYSKFRIFCPFQRVHRTKSGVIHFVPPGQQYPYAVRRISLDPCAFDKLPSAVLDFLKGGVVQQSCTELSAHISLCCPYLHDIDRLPVAGCATVLIDQILQGFAGYFLTGSYRDMQRKVIPPPLCNFRPCVLHRLRLALVYPHQCAWQQVHFGNNQKNENVFQVGIMGIDFASEGPLSKKHKASYLFNYRYSTTGLLNLEGGTMDYQDLNFKLIFFQLLNKGGFTQQPDRIFTIWLLCKAAFIYRVSEL